MKQDLFVVDGLKAFYNSLYDSFYNLDFIKKDKYENVVFYESIKYNKKSKKNAKVSQSFIKSFEKNFPKNKGNSILHSIDLSSYQSMKRIINRTASSNSSFYLYMKNLAIFKRLQEKKESLILPIHSYHLSMKEEYYSLLHFLWALKKELERQHISSESTANNVSQEIKKNIKRNIKKDIIKDINKNITKDINKDINSKKKAQFIYCYILFPDSLHYAQQYQIAQKASLTFIEKIQKNPKWNHLLEIDVCLFELEKGFLKAKNPKLLKAFQD